MSDANDGATRGRTLSDAEALDKIIEMYETWGQQEIFENTSTTIESIGDIVEQTGRKAWFEDPGYLKADIWSR